MHHHYSEKKAMQRYAKMLAQKRPFYLNANYNLEMLMKDLDTNRAYASRFINNTLNTSFPTLLRNLRIDYAIKQIKTHHNMKISEIALSSGFNNMTSFRRAYFDRFGCTPSNNIAQLRAEVDNLSE